jgi:hypothetical protein
VPAGITNSRPRVYARLTRPQAPSLVPRLFQVPEHFQDRASIEQPCHNFVDVRWLRNGPDGERPIRLSRREPGVCVLVRCVGLPTENGRFVADQGGRGALPHPRLSIQRPGETDIGGITAPHPAAGRFVVRFATAASAPRERLRIVGGTKAPAAGQPPAPAARV